MIEVRLDGFSGNPRSLISWEQTVTGVVVRIYPPLATALDLQKSDQECEGNAPVDQTK